MLSKEMQKKSIKDSVNTSQTMELVNLEKNVLIFTKIMQPTKKLMISRKSLRI